jgi:hypothetical protein
MNQGQNEPLIGSYSQVLIVAGLEPENPSRTGEGSTEDTTYKLKGHDNEPHPPKHADKSPFQDNEPSASDPTQSSTTLSNTSVESITERFHGECTGGIKLDT